MRKLLFFPGKISVTFRKGPLGYLRQDPTDAAKLVKDNPSLQDRSAPVKEELVRKKCSHCGPSERKGFLRQNRVHPAVWEIQGEVFLLAP